MREDAGTAEASSLEGVVEGVAGWFLLETGQLSRVRRDETQMRLSLSSAYGPRLLAPSGEAAQGPFLGEGISYDGGVSLVLTAEDQLYYAELASNGLATEPGLGEELGPRLTPEPNFPVRSLARDRTADLFTGEGARIRGWVATGRGVFRFWQDAKTEAWEQEQLALGSGEPVEVWTREAGGHSHGRVGLRDGQVLRLPDGIPLTQPLPQADRVVDYADLSGWPVALGEKALYRTLPGSGGAAGLLPWQAVSMPSEFPAGWLSGARIFVASDGTRPILYLFTRTGFVYQLSK